MGGGGGRWKERKGGGDGDLSHTRELRHARDRMRNFNKLSDLTSRLHYDIGICTHYNTHHSRIQTTNVRPTLPYVEILRHSNPRAQSGTVGP